MRISLYTKTMLTVVNSSSSTVTGIFCCWALETQVHFTKPIVVGWILEAFFYWELLCSFSESTKLVDCLKRPSLLFPRTSPINHLIYPHTAGTKGSSRLSACSGLKRVDCRWASLSCFFAMSTELTPGWIQTRRSRCGMRSKHRGV